MNSPSYPPEVQEFVEEAVAAGDYASEGDVLVDAVRALREIKRQHQSLRNDVQAGFDELDAGQGEAWDVDELKRELHQKLDGDKTAR
ncbi:MAG: type II toxin-antitoxin system ParD family antitoxin [Planctomycetes bacterium]|nr:type II toxin-antitoxin system ParD family antitoxin [Planctomycetota bacterium]